MRSGGTNNLLANLAVLLSFEKDLDINYIEYPGGSTIDYVKKSADQLYIKHISPPEKVILDDGLLIMTLLDVKNIYSQMVLGDNVRLLLWSTHPDDAIKILPTFNFFYHVEKHLRLRIANLITPIQKKKTRMLLNKGIELNGLVWMDNHNFEVNDYFYNLNKDKIEIWPLVVSSSKVKFITHVKTSNNQKINIVILGRLCDFKVNPILALLESAHDIRDKIILNFIGTGDHQEILENKLKKLSYSYNFVGNVDKSILDEELLKYDILLGMGTSVLEGAKLGMPSIVMNGTYIRNSKVPLFEWIYNCPEYFIGELEELSEYSKLNSHFNNLLDDVAENAEYVGNCCLEHFTKYHSDESFKTIAINTINTNQFYFGEIKSYVKLTLGNQSVNWLKSLIKKI